MPSGMEIVHELGGMFGMQSLDRFQLDNDLVKTDEVWLVKPAIAALVHDVQLFLGDERNATQFQLLLQRVLIDLFEITVSKRLVNLKDCASNSIRLLFKYQLFIYVPILSKTQRAFRRNGIRWHGSPPPPNDSQMPSAAAIAWSMS